MAYLRFMVVVILCVAFSETSSGSILEEIVPMEMFIDVRKFFLNMFGRTASTKAMLGRARSLKKLQGEIEDEHSFPCKVKGFSSTQLPDDVNKLMPGDVSVIGALGDSLTAGNGAAASNLLHVYTENRGISWSIGGQGNWREFLTLPNIIKVFNPRLVGYSTGDGLSTDRESQFNVAEAGAMSRDMPYMAKELIKRIKNDPRVNMTRDWKMVTILIGSNDFCLDVCYVDTAKTAEWHRRNLTKALDVLRDNLPRTFVNLVASPNIARVLHSFKSVKPICWMTHRVECPCLMGSRFSKNLKYYLSTIEKWRQVEREVVSLPKYHKKDFTVVLQTFTDKVIFPETPEGKTDYSLMSEDCFHFSQKGYARGANALWNNLLEPVGSKSTDWSAPFEKFHCPTTKNPYFYTRENSNTV